MHSADIMQQGGLHPGAVRGHDPSQSRYRQHGPVLGEQAIGVQPAALVAAVAGHAQQGRREVIWRRWRSCSTFGSPIGCQSGGLMGIPRAFNLRLVYSVMIWTRNFPCLIEGSIDIAWLRQN
jgi:hypothetical protein